MHVVGQNLEICLVLFSLLNCRVRIWLGLTLAWCQFKSYRDRGLGQTSGCFPASAVDPLPNLRARCFVKLRLSLSVVG